MTHPYNGIQAVITTKHGKEGLIAPVFKRLGVEVLLHQWDTDQLGTFSPETPRINSQRDTVIKKARTGILETGCSYGIASEGSVGPDVAFPILNSTVEAIVWVDEINGFELIEYQRGLDIVAVRERFANLDGIDEFLERADFPNHALIVYPDGTKEPIYKGLRTRIELEDAFKKCVEESPKKLAIVESDLRAHMSPSRSEVIVKCAERIVARLSQLCPSCQLPGFGEVGRLFGLACESCGADVPTALRGVVTGCVKCDYKLEKLTQESNASSRSCPSCNP